MLLCQPCAEEESSIDSQIIGNIVSFLSNKTKNGGPDSYISKITKTLYLPHLYSHNQQDLTKYDKGYPSTKPPSTNSQATTTTNAIFNPTIFNYQNTTNILSRH
jgi:hypothetical protein